jgi:hypothetical protein
MAFLSLRRALTVFVSFNSPMNPSSNLRSKKRFGRKPAAQKKVKTKAAAAKPKTKAKTKSESKSNSKSKSDR